MRVKLARGAAFLLALILTVGLCFGEASAQKRRRGRSRRIANPVIKPDPATQQNTAQPSDPDAQIISTAEQQNSEQATGRPAANSRTGKGQRTGAPAESEAENVRRTINKLSTQVNQLSDRLGQVQEQQRTLVNLERLTRAEQRAEGLRAQLRDVQSKESDLQARLEQTEFALQPENIERAIALVGTTRPEELRDQRRRQLESERTRLRTQLEQLAANRTRLETSIATADAEADKIRQQLDAATNAAINNNVQNNTANSAAPATAAPNEPGQTTTPPPTTTTTPPPPFTPPL
ncbi:MAG TPA: hypothetical protein VF507_03415 [Pyrinomonadaceae bacterium]|jgi:DNA repair exonuclease SbcCD ATPase subunit